MISALLAVAEMFTNIGKAIKKSADKRKRDKRYKEKLEQQKKSKD